MTAVADAVADLERWLPAAEILLAAPDTDGQRGRGRPGSSPPWNSAVAAALLDALEGVARLRVALILEVTGRAAPRPAAAVTGRSIAAIAALCEALPAAGADGVARQLSGYVRQIQQLPAIGRQERWERLRQGPDGRPPMCPFCGCCTLRVCVAAGVVICLMPDCADSDGNRPRGRMEIGAVSAQPCVTWADGLVT